MNEPKIYVPKCSAKSHTFQNGGEIIKIAFHADTLAEFVKNHANEKGFVNFIVGKRREVGNYGETHTVMLDTWKPSGSPAAKPASQPTARTPSQPTSAEPEEDDVPF